MSLFYAKLPKYFIKNVSLVRAEIFDGRFGDYKNYLREHYFQYFEEFKKFWMKERGEVADWELMVLRQHNTDWFLQWCFKKYPLLLQEELKDHMKLAEKSIT